MTERKTERRPSPSLRPSDFVNPALADMSVGDVIRDIHVREAKRSRDTGEYEERDVLISFRSAPDGLIGALDGIARQTGMHKSVVTKCLSAHLMSWYQCLPQVGALVSAYNALSSAADGYPDIWRKMSSDSYEFVCPRGIGTRSDKAYMRTIAFVLGYLGNLSDPLGVPVTKLFLAGMCWSITTNTENWLSATVDKYLIPERDKMLNHINERVSLFRYIEELILVRNGKKDINKTTKELMDSLGGVTQSPNTQYVLHG